MAVLEFAILGPLEVRRDGELVPITAAKHRIVLATLLIRANEVVDADVIVQRLWGDQPPVGARKTVQGYVARLRRLLGWETIGTRSPGYVIHVDQGRLDLQRFDALVLQARSLADDPDQCSALLSSALALWRGVPLADVPSEFLQSVDAVRLAELRVEVLGRRIEADLMLGRHTELIYELRELVTAYPYDEGFAGQLMVALHRSKRRVDALAVYRQTRDLLVNEIGVEPGAPLQALHQTILAAEDAELPTGSTLSGTATVPAPTAVPSQLPPDTADLVGRGKEISALRDCLAEPVTVACVAGQGGVGKTAVAVHAAYLERESFPDGQLYVNLRGVDEDPLDPLEVLGRFLRALGVLGSALPATLEERSAYFRSIVADRRILVLLDNAADEAQVRPLLPAGTRAATIVTSRRVLAGLDGARHVELDLLNTDDAVELMATMIGHERVDRDIDEARRIVRMCGLLPLAVRIAGARLLARPYHRLPWLAARLADERRRLNELALGDQAVRANIGLSYRNLHAPARRAFRLLSLVEPRTFSPWVAEAILGLDGERAQDVLDTLVEHRMLEVALRHDGESVCYRFHDLVRIFARERAAGEQELDQAPAVLSRVLAYATELAYRRIVTLRISSLTVAPPGITPGGRDPVADPLSWLEWECPMLVALVRQAAEERLAGPALALAWTLWPYLYLKAHFDFWRTTVDAVLAALGEDGDPRSYAIVLSARGSLREAAGDHRSALLDFAEAARLFERLGDPHGQARAEVCLALERGIEGDPAAHVAYCERALPRLRRYGDRAGEAIALHHLSIAHRERGDVGRARDCAARSAAMFADLGDQFGEARARSVLVACEAEVGDIAAAAEQNARWLRLCRAMRDRRGEAYALQAQAELSLRRGDAQHARAVLAPALRTAQEIGWRLGLPLMYFTMGELCRVRGEYEAGVRYLRDAVVMWAENNYPIWHARALSRLGDVYRDAGRGDEATAAWRQARRIFAEVGSPEGDGLRARPGLA